MNDKLIHCLKTAQWVVAPEHYPAPVIMRSFNLTSPSGGRIALSALGFFILHVNGKRIGNDYFLPSNSLFHARRFEHLAYPIFDQFTYRCYYSVYDISSFLQTGENTIEIALGDGWYRQTGRVAEGTMAFGSALGAIYAVLAADADGEHALCSDGSESCRTTAITDCQLFYGETYDARIDAERRYAYAPVRTICLPDTLLTPEDSAPDRIIRKITPTLIRSDGQRKIYDAGENISGFVSLRTHAAWGEKVILRFAEEMEGDRLLFESTGSGYTNAQGKPQIMEDTFIGDGEAHLYTPQFVWHAFRFFEIIGDGETQSVNVVHSDVPVAAGFDSDSDELNWLFSAFVRTQLNNMHSGVPSDCPHRERLGYTGDGQICAPAAMTFLSSQAFYRKWIRDIFDSQDIVTGHVNHTAPFAGGGGGPGGWGCAAILVPYYYFKYFGDAAPLADHYDDMKKWVAYLISHSENGLVVREEDGGWCLGDWCTLEKTVIPEPLVNTCYFIKSMRCLKEIAGFIGRKDDIPMLDAHIAEASAAIISRYYDEKTGDFAGDIQGANAFALYAGLGGSATFANLTARYRALGHYDTGFLCTDILCGLFFENGQEDLAFDLLSSHALGSFAYMKDHGATTIWEDWRGDSSHDHPMFGACARFLISSILGIKQRENSVAFRNIIIAPRIPARLQRASGYTTLPAGRVSVRWHKDKGSIHFEIVLPEHFECDFEYDCNKRHLSQSINTFSIVCQ